MRVCSTAPVTVARTRRPRLISARAISLSQGRASLTRCPVSRMTANEIAAYSVHFCKQLLIEAGEIQFYTNVSWPSKCWLVLSLWKWQRWVNADVSIVPTSRTQKPFREMNLSFSSFYLLKPQFYCMYFIALMFFSVTFQLFYLGRRNRPAEVSDVLHTCPNRLNYFFYLLYRHKISFIITVQATIH